jgi:hypothetical protein
MNLANFEEFNNAMERLHRQTEEFTRRMERQHKKSAHRKKAKVCCRLRN